MYVILLIIVLLVVLFMMKSNRQVETFKNIGKNLFSQVRRVDFNKNNNNENPKSKSEIPLYHDGSGMMVGSWPSPSARKAVPSASE